MDVQNLNKLLLDRRHVRQEMIDVRLTSAFPSSNGGAPPPQNMFHVLFFGIESDRKFSHLYTFQKVGCWVTMMFRLEVVGLTSNLFQ